MTTGSVRGYSLIELGVVLAVLAILAVLATPVAELTARRAKEHQLRVSLERIRDALDAYKLAVEKGDIRAGTTSGYPPSLTILVEGVPSARDPQQRRVYFLRAIPRDPFAPSADTAAETWELRSYRSPPEAPRPGDDVYDVHSRSQIIALDGRPYSQW